MKRTENKSMFSTWMVLFMSIAMLFSACGDLTEDMETKSDSKRTTKSTYVQNKEKEVTGPTTEECRWEKVTEIDGQKTVKKFAYTLKRSLEPIAEYRKDVSGFGYSHKQNNQIAKGESSEVRTEDGGIAKIYGRTDKLSQLKVNGFDTDDVTMPWDFYHEKLVFDDGEVQVTFDYDEISFSEKNTEVKSIASPVTGKDAARLTGTISTKYVGYSQESSESVVLLMEKGVTITDEDFVTSTEKETVTDNKVTAYILYRVNKSDGTHEDYPLEFSDTRDSSVDNPFTSIQTSNTQSTSSVKMVEVSSADKSDSKDGATAKWKRYSYTNTSVTTLADGTKKENIARTTEPEGWQITFRGKTHTFKRPTYSVTNTRGSVTGGTEKDGYKVYDFADNFSYTRGSNSKSFVPKGTIKVKVEEEPTFFPKEWGKLKRAKQTVANNEKHNGHVYTLLLEFEENVKLPVVIRPGSTRPEWHFEYAEVTTVSDYNGGTYDKSTNTWICTTASDKPNQMVWTRNSKEKANKDYQIARNQNWDEGHMVDGHPSTQTSRYQMTVSSDGRLTLVDTYTGTNMGNWK